MRRLAKLLVLLASVYSMVVSAEAQPSPLRVTKTRISPFVGTWVIDVAGSESGQPDGRAAAPATVVISRDKKGLRVETVRDGKPLLVTYPFEQGSDPIGTTGGRTVGTMQWEDGSLVTTTPYQVNGMAVTTVERRSLSGNGKEMTIVTTVAVQHGYESGPNASAPLKQVFRRVR